MRLRTEGPTVCPAGSLGYLTEYSYYPWYSDWRKLRDYYPVPQSDVVTSSKMCLDELHPGPPYKSGGPLSILDYKVTGLSSTVDAYTSDGGPESRCAGTVVSTFQPSLPTGFDMDAGGNIDTDSTFGDVDAYGATGWNKFKPAKPAADLGVFLAEIKDVPRTLMQTANFFKHFSVKEAKKFTGSGSGFKPTAKGTGEGSLAIQFGWMPFLRDMCDFYNTYKTLDSRIQRIKEYNNRWERRGGTVEVDEESWSSEVTGGCLTSTLGSSYPWETSSMRAVIDYKISNKVWFTAKFKYYIPPKSLSSVIWNRRAVASMFGGTITPSVLWEATPWSWLIDWFSNAGDVFANMSDGLADNLVASYAYVMGTRQYAASCQHIADAKTGTGVNFTTTHSWISKRRAEANPFGFGLTFDTLSAKQLSILISLGMARGL